MSSLLELSIASNNLQVEGAQMLVPVLQDNGAMSILDVSSNNIGELVLPGGWKSKDDDDAAPWLRIADEHEQDKHPGKPEGVIALAEAISSANGALVNLNVSNNSLGPEGATALVPAM